MNLRKTLILACALAVAVIYILQVDEPRSKELLKKDLLFKRLVVQEVETVEIAKQGQPAFTLKNNSPAKSDDKPADEKKPAPPVTDQFKSWEISGLSGSMLDAAPANGLLSSLQQLKLDNSVPAEETDPDAAVYGLKDPVLTLRVKTLDVSEELHFGTLNAYVNMRYLKRGGSPTLYLVPDHIFTSANKNRDDFRDRTPVDFADADIKQISIDADGKTIVLAEDAEKKWRLLQPIEAAASGRVAVDFMRNLRNLRAQEFIDAPAQPAAYGLEKPAVKVALEFKDAAKPKLEIAAGIIPASKDKEEKSYLSIAGRPAVYLLSANPLAGLKKSPDDFRERKLLTLAPQKVKEVTIEVSGREAVKVARPEGHWKVNGKDGDYAFIMQLLNDLSQLEAQTFPGDVKDPGLESPAAKITLIVEGETPEKPPVEQVLSIGKEFKTKDKKGYYAGVTGLPYIVTIAEDAHKKATPREEALLPVKLAATPAAPAAPKSGQK